MLSRTKLKRSQKRFFWELLVILFLGLVALLWFRPGQIIDCGDINLAINPPDFTYRLFHIWDSRNFAGYDSSQQVSLLFPYSLFFTAFHYLGFSLIAAEKSYFILMFTLSGFSMYYLVYFLTRNRIASFMAAIFYMFNIPKVDSLFAGDFHTPLMYGVLPFTLVFLIKGLNAEKLKIRYSILIAFTTLFFCNWHPAITIAALFIFAVYFLFHTGATRFKLFAANSKFILLTIIMAGLFNSWWLYSMIHYLTSGATSVGLVQAVAGDVSWLRIMSKNSSILWLFRLTGEFFWNQSALGEELAPYSVSYLQNPWLIIITYAVPLLAFTALLFKPKDRNVLFFSISALFYIVLAAGPKPPAGRLYVWFFQNVPGFSIFRSPYHRFSLMITFCYAFLIGISGSEIYDYLKRKKRWSFFGILHLEKFSIGIILAIVLISAWPLFTSHISHSKCQKLQSWSISMPPSYYDEAASWLESAGERDSRLLLLPDVEKFVSFITYEWGYAGGSDIIQHIFATPLISNTGSMCNLGSRPTQELVANLCDSLYSKRRASYKILRLLNVDRIVVRNDVDTAASNIPHTSEVSRNALELLSPVITFERSFGKLDFYKLDGRYFLPHIYSSATPVIIDGDVEALVPMVETKYLDGKPALLFTEQNEDREKLLPKSEAFVFSNSSPLDITLQILLPGYGIKVSDSKKPVVFEAKEDGIYQIWKKGDALQASGLRPQALAVKIDGRSLTPDPRSSILEKAVKWEWMGSIELKKGKYRIAAKDVPLEMTIVPEEKLIETQKRVLSYLKKAKGPPIYFFSKGLSGAVDSWEERSLKGSFYVPSSGDYYLRAKISPQYVKAPDYGLKERMGRNSEDKYIKNRDYTFNERIGLEKKFPPEADQPLVEKRERSKVVLSRSLENLDLRKYPYINLIHQNEDPKSLLVNTILYLDFDGDGEADRKVIQEGIIPNNSSFDALELVKSEFPGKKHYYLTKLVIKIFKNPEIEGREFLRIKEGISEIPSSIFLQHLQIYNEEIIPYGEARLASPTLKIDYEELSLIKSGFWYTASPLYLEEGYHSLDALFPGLESKLDFVAIEPRVESGERREKDIELSSYQAIEQSSKQEPEIVFQKINPTKYRVKVKNATEPFWLVFSEGFHPQWRAYIEQRAESREQREKKRSSYQAIKMEEIVAEYPRLGVKEARHLQRFTPGDIRYLFRKADIEEHYLVNGYANAWYIPVDQLASLPVSQLTNEPTSKLTNQPTNEMEIVLYFWPQGLFYVGLFISGLTLVGCLSYLLYATIKRKKSQEIHKF